MSLSLPLFIGLGEGNIRPTGNRFVDNAFDPRGTDCGTDHHDSGEGGGHADGFSLTARQPREDNTFCSPVALCRWTSGILSGGVKESLLRLLATFLLR